MLESYDESNIFQILDHLHYEPNTFLIDNINQQNNYFTSYINEDKIYFNNPFKKPCDANNKQCEMKKEVISERHVHFVTNKETPPMILKNEISGILTNEINIFKKINEILDKEDKGDYLENNIIVNVKKQIMGKAFIKIKKKSNKGAFTMSRLLGRKRINDDSLRNHNKYSPDNIVNKIKTIIKKYIILFVNNVIDNLYTDDMKDTILSELEFPKYRNTDLIKDVNYKITANTKKKRDNLLLLDYTLEKFLSFDISGRYRKMTENKEFSKLNKKIISDYLLKDDNINLNVFKFILKKLKFEDFLGLFIRTKELDDFPSFNQLNNYEQNIIRNSLVTIEEYLKELHEENDDVHFICFLLLIYNFRRYFSVKAERKKKNSENVKNNKNPKNKKK